MALREYLWRGNTWQFEETEAPADALLLDVAARTSKAASSIKAATPKSNKAATPASNKRTRTRKKSGE